MKPVAEARRQCQIFERHPGCPDIAERSGVGAGADPGWAGARCMRGECSGQAQKSRRLALSGCEGARHRRRPMVSAHRARRPRRHTTLRRLSEKPRSRPKHPVRSPSDAGRPWHIRSRAGLRWDGLSRICSNACRTDAVSGHRGSATVGRATFIRSWRAIRPSGRRRERPTRSEIRSPRAKRASASPFRHDREEARDKPSRFQIAGWGAADVFNSRRTSAVEDQRSFRAPTAHASERARRFPAPPDRTRHFSAAGRTGVCRETFITKLKM